MGGSPTMNDILLRMKAHVFRDPARMLTVVILEDLVYGEDYKFSYRDSDVRVRGNMASLAEYSIRKLAVEWPANV